MKPRASTDVPDPLLAALSAGLSGVGPVVLAVSGGRDSMALLAAVGRAGLGQQVAAVATFDHGTGPAATTAADLVAQVARAAGYPVERGRVDAALRAREADWRSARVAFLQAVAMRHAARLVTAHTRDDQRETVAFRLLRGAGPRGLAGLDTDGPVLRPWLGVARADVASWATAHDVHWIEDPSNDDRRHARNRLRLDLLPALERAVPGFGAWLDDIARRSAAWRRAVDGIAATLDPDAPSGNRTNGGARSGVIAAAALGDYTPEELAVLWPALLARRGVTADRRGTQRLARFTTTKAVGTRVPLSGNAEVVRVRDGFVVRGRPDAGELSGERALVPDVWLGTWRFHPGEPGAAPWHARLPTGRSLTVRSWRDGDRLELGGGATRRVARFLAEAGLSGPERRGWPVVLVDGRIVWIPGICCGDVAGPADPATEWSVERSIG
ncbi:MAG: tRNA lysidine(34) synthetase TilS [Gemmatimonadetes bacterium]|nr:tRNA lysidine(34) synthetase TilS [Gemmatimonadota bacterium]